MSVRKRGERNWVDRVDGYTLHQPTRLCDDLEQVPETEPSNIITICGHDFLKGADGKLVAIDD